MLCMYILVLTEYKQVQASMCLVCSLILGDELAYANNCSGYVYLDINVLPSRIEFAHHSAPLLAMSDTQASAQQWLEYSGSSTGCADAAAEDGRRGSNVYEVNKWLWQFGRGKPSLGCLIIKETWDRQDSASKASDKRQKGTHLEPSAIRYHVWYHIIMISYMIS